MREQAETTAKSELAALERFVVENDELLELEERIGRFNIFDALGVVRAEIRHSNFLAWLLDPNESHGQGALFLNAVLMDLLKEAPAEMRPLSPVELDGEELRGVEVRREWRNIDLLITCKEPPFVIAVENKIDSGESKGQLKRYKTIVHEYFSELKPMFVFLTTDGVEPSDDDWVPYSYADIHRVLERVRRTGAGAIGDDVEAYLEHYLRLIGSRFMDDPKIDELCQRIYKNHRQAIDLIVERVGGASARLLALVEDVVREESQWIICRRTSQRLRVVPCIWTNLLPPVGTEKSVDDRLWLNVLFKVNTNRIVCFVSVRPTTDAEIRRCVIERLTQDPKEFGLKTFFKTVSSHYTNLGRESVIAWTDDEEVDDEAITNSVRKKLGQLESRFAEVPDALRPIIEEWEASR